MTKKLVLLLGVCVLIGCGENDKSGNGGSTDSDAGTSESASGESALVSASPESQLIGYWALNTEKIIKAWKADPPEGIKDIEEAIGDLREDPAFGKDAANFLKFEENGILRVYDGGQEEETETYSLVIDGNQDAPIRINAKVDSRDASMILIGETLQIFMPEDQPVNLPLFLSRISEEEANRRVALAAERRAAEPVEPKSIGPDTLEERYE